MPLYENTDFHSIVRIAREKMIDLLLKCDIIV